MFKRILIAYDGSEGARGALLVGVDLARRAGADVSSVSVEEHLPRYAASISEVEGAKEQIDAHFREVTKQARDAAALDGVELETHIKRGQQVEEIVALARDGRFDLVVLGSHGHSRLVERLIGTTSLGVARLAPCSTWIARTRGRPARGLDAVKRILVGLDGSPLGRIAFHRVLDVAVAAGAAVVGVTVREGSPLASAEGWEDRYAEQVGSAAAEQARSAAVPFEHVVRRGHAAQTLIDAARDKACDLIVVGATGLERPWSASIGGTATGVVSEARCSVLLVRSPRANLHVADVMIRNVSAVTAETPLRDVVELLLRRDVKALPVIDDRRHVVGVITGGDLLARGDLKLRLSLTQQLETEALRERLQTLAQSRLAARDVMSHPVHRIGPDADLTLAVRLMASHRLKRLPVVNAAGELVGILSRADVLRAVAALPEPAAVAERPLPAARRVVGDAVIAEVPVVAPDAGVEEVLEKLMATPLRRVVVVEADGTVRGLISDRDVLARSNTESRPWLVRVLRGQRAGSGRAAGPAAPGVQTASALMAPTVIVVRPQDSLAHAIRLMMQHRIKRLPVVDDEGRLRGLVDRREILRLLAMDVGMGP